MPATAADALLARWQDDLAPLAANTAAETAADKRPDAAGGGPQRMLLSVERSAMACQFEVLLNQHQYAAGAERAVACLDLIEQLEAKLSIYRPHSDLSLVNRFAAQRPIAVSPDTFKLLQLAVDVFRLTDGAFDITAGSLSEVWGFSRRQAALPTPEEIAAAVQVVGSQYVQLDEQLSQVQLTRSGVKTNSGGIGKGYALDRAAGYLLQHQINDFMIHGGLSSVTARGDRQHPLTGGGWLVSLRHPLRLQSVLGTIRLRNLALGTSGSGKQFFHFGGQRYSHIIDPRSGWPAQGMLSATVLCRSGAVADALATALFVMGSESAAEFCRRHPSIAAILLTSDSPSGRLRIETHNLSEDQWQPQMAAT